MSDYENFKSEEAENIILSASIYTAPLFIRCLRKSIGFSQSDLAELLDVSPASVAHWESGRSTPPGLYAMVLGALHDKAISYIGKHPPTALGKKIKKYIQQHGKQKAIKFIFSTNNQEQHNG